MADTVDTKVIINSPRYYGVRLTNESDGTGESAVVKVDISGLSAGPDGTTPTSLSLLEASWSVSAGTYVVLEWDATTPDEMLVCVGSNSIDYSGVGGLHDPKSTGTTGDIKLTTDGFADGDGYNITLLFKKKD